MPILILTLFLALCVIVCQRRELKNYESKQIKRRRNLIQYSAAEFPILRLAFRPGPLYEVQACLQKHRDERITRAVDDALKAFDTRPSRDMIDFHVKKCMEMPARSPEVVHILYQAKVSYAADWDKLSENVKLQLRLINRIVNSLRTV